MQKYVVWFKDVDKEDLSLVGGKGANLGEMMKAGIPVPNGFIVTADAYNEFIEHNKLNDTIKKILAELDVSNSRELEKVSEKIQNLIIASEIPPEMGKEIISYYLKLGRLFHDPYVAIRSSATAEDLPTASFAGQQATFLNIKGEAAVVTYVRKCWASLFTGRAIFYRTEHKFNHFKVGIAVPVQKMVQSDKSGIMFTINPVNQDKETIIIEATYGLGELIVQGAITPDHYEVDKKTGAITHKKIYSQERMMLLKGGKTVTIDVPKNQAHMQKLTDGEISDIAELGKKLEKHYYFPQDIEWAIEKGKIFITQTRPITTIHDVSNKNSKLSDSFAQKTAYLKGDPASPGIASGPIIVIHDAREIHKVHSGDILVAPQTNPDYVPAMRRALAIVTETGGRTSHAAIVSRELGIPAIVGVQHATQLLKNGQVITVDGSRGAIYNGGVTKSKVHREYNESRLVEAPRKDYTPHRTATKVYVNLADPKQAGAVAKRAVDGVGLLRAEFMIAGIGVHPKKFIKDKKENVFIHELSSKIAVICEAFHPRPVVYRATDFRTNEYRNLTGGKEFEPEEANPMLGFRGCYRYINDPRVFELELEAIKRVRNKRNLKNLWLMIPYIHTPYELVQVKKIIAANGLSRSASFKIWIMVELPANVIMLDSYLEQGVDGVSIGSNDLTMLMLGVDRDNNEVSHVYNEREDAMMWAYEKVIKICHKHDVTVSMCGQAPSDYMDLVERLVHLGITSISVNHDVIEQVRDTIYEAEKNLIHKRS